MKQKIVTVDHGSSVQVGTETVPAAAFEQVAACWLQLHEEWDEPQRKLSLSLLSDTTAYKALALQQRRALRGFFAQYI